ncbi:MAG: sulfatase [Roseibacillus sp.]
MNRVLIPLLVTLASGIGDPASAAERPNILFCISDDQSWPHAGAYGCKWVKTPGFDRVAREGILFNRCYTPNAKCAPSRACILTGRNSWQLEAACNHWCFFPAKFKSVMEALGENGYEVGFTSKGWAPGIAKDAEGKARELTGKRYNARKSKPPTRAISSSDYAGNFDDFLEKVPAGKSWMFWYGCTEPHRGYEFQSGVKKGGKKLSEVEGEVFKFWPDSETVRHDMLDYAMEIEHFDDHLVRMLATLEKGGQLDNTLVIVTADNGMPFPRIKGQEYEMSNHLPLAIRWSKGIAKPGRQVDDYVNFIDFAPTFLEVAGVGEEKSAMQRITGRSLVEIFKSEKGGQVVAGRDHVLIGKERHDIGRPNDGGYPIRGLVKDGMLYLRNFEPERWPQGNPVTGYLNCDGGPTKTQILNLSRAGTDKKYWRGAFGKRPSEELYNVAKDPECVVNLAEREDYRSVAREMQEELFRRLVAQGDPRMEGKKDYFESMPYADGRGKGFYEKFMAGKKPGAGWVNKSDFEEKDPE